MAGVVVVLLVGVPAGLLMVFRRRGGHRLLVGSGIVGASVVIAILAVACSGRDVQTPSATVTYPSLTFEPPIMPFVPPPVVTRGALDIIGYRTGPGPDGQLIATVEFWAPEVASKLPAGTAPPAPCELAPHVLGAGTDHVTVDLELAWSPTTAAGVSFNGECKADGSGPRVRRSYVVGPVSPEAKLYTSTPEVDTPLPRLG